MQQVTEPLPVARSVLVAFALFPVVGLAVATLAAREGSGPVALLWLAVFAGMPTAALVAMLRGRGRRGFGVSEVGLHGAAGREDGVLPWGDVHRLRWSPTGTSVNEEVLCALVADTPAGEVRVTTRAGNRRAFQEPLERSLLRGGLVPERLLTELVTGRLATAPQTVPHDLGGGPPRDVVTGDPLADIEDARHRDGAPGPPPPTGAATSAPPPLPPGRATDTPAVDDAPHWPSRD